MNLLENPELMSTLLLKYRNDRLQKGTYNKNDIDLLIHELFKSKFEGIFKTDYRTARDKTLESWRP